MKLIQNNSRLFGVFFALILACPAFASNQPQDVFHPLCETPREIRFDTVRFIGQAEQFARATELTPSFEALVSKIQEMISITRNFSQRIKDVQVCEVIRYEFRAVQDAYDLVDDEYFNIKQKGLQPDFYLSQQYNNFKNAYLDLREEVSY